MFCFKPMKTMNLKLTYDEQILLISALGKYMRSAETSALVAVDDMNRPLGAMYSRMAGRSRALLERLTALEEPTQPTASKTEAVIDPPEGDHLEGDRQPGQGSTVST